MATLIKDKYEAHKAEVNERFEQLRTNEEELNRIFARIYNMEGEVPIEVEDKYVSVARIFDTAEEITESYKGNILPITDDEYFGDDIVARLIDFVRVAYGEETLEENLRFMADSLDPSAGCDARTTIRAYFLKGFYADHCKTYKKRPIYWLFDSGKKNGFKCLVYMHRYQPDLLARIRTDYVLPHQERYRTRLSYLDDQMQVATARQKAQLTKERKRIEAQATELAGYEEKIHHLADQMIKIDLDDGVNVNYAKFADVLAKVK